MSRTSLFVSLLLIGLATFSNGQGGWKQPTGNTCVGWGDPHIWTWDGELYATQGVGYYHLLVSEKINVQARFDVGCGGNDVTCVVGFRVFVVNDADEIHSFELKADFLPDNSQPTTFRKPFKGYNFAYMTYIDGADAHMVPAVNGGDADLVKAGINQLVGTNGGGKVAYFTDNSIYSVNFKFNNIVIQFLPWTIAITPIDPAGGAVNELYNNVCGLCGTFTGRTSDDFFTRGQRFFNLDGNSENFAATWRVTAADARNGYFSCSGGPSPTVKPTNPPSTPTNPPTAVPTRPATQPPTEQPPTPTPAGTPTPASPTPTPSGPTPAPTPEPTEPATQPPTSRPTNPATQPPTVPPSDAPTPAPTPVYTTGVVTTGDSTSGGNNNQTTNITVIVDQFNGTQAFTDANATCCADAHICVGDPLYEPCMMDILKTNSTTLAVSSAGALVLAGCAKTNITDSSCTQGSLFACPGACNGAGSCVAGKCQCRSGFKNDEESGSCIKAGLTDAQLIAVGVSAGIVAAIVIGAVVFLALAGFGAKKGYDYYHMRDNKMANVNSNPLYNEKKTGGVSPLYADKA